MGTQTLIQHVTPVSAKVEHFIIPAAGICAELYLDILFHSLFGVLDHVPSECCFSINEIYASQVTKLPWPF